MLDFTSALYLGLEHPKYDLPYWSRLTTGRPAALGESPGSRALGQVIARRQGLHSGMVAPSTLHLFWDLFGILDKRRFIIFADSHLYPIGKAGVEKARGNGMEVIYFRHLDPIHLEREMSKKTFYNKRPLVITDGWCPRCGQPAAIPQYLSMLRPLNGLLVLDDTQSLGIFGSRPNKQNPFGTGGGGILQWWSTTGPDIISISSLAKAFGVPLAAICGSEKWMDTFHKKSVTRISSSPVSNAHLEAGIKSLEINSLLGDKKRNTLLTNIRFFQKEVKKTNIPLKGGPFPVQTLPFSNRRKACYFYQQLVRAGIQTALLAPHIDERIAILFIVRADHRLQDLRRSGRLISELTATKFNLIS